MLLETVTAGLFLSSTATGYYLKKYLVKKKETKKLAQIEQAKKDKHEYHLNLIKTNDLDSIRQVIKTEVLFRAYLKIMEKFESNNLVLDDNRKYYKTLYFSWTENDKNFTFDVCKHLKSSYVYDRSVTPVIVINDYNEGELDFWVTVFDHLNLEQLREEVRQIEIRKERRKIEQQEAVDKFFSKGI